MSPLPSDDPAPTATETAPDLATQTATQTPTESFTAHRDLLFSVVYNMLGTVADTEDVLQETWLAWAARSRAAGSEAIRNPRSYLVRIAANRAIDHQAALSRRRETYVGPWLPEPLATPRVQAPASTGTGDAADAVLHAESVSMALLVVLETLSPLERGVFVLHEVFGYTHTEIAGILDRSPSAVRQLAHRARAHVDARRPRYEPDPAVRQQVTERFLAATLGGDVDALLEVLAPEVTLWGDGGGKGHPAAGLRTLHGRDEVVRTLVRNARRFGSGLDIVYRSVNGDPSVLMCDGGTTRAVLVLDLLPGSDQVCGIYIVANPAKLTHVV
ncbi:RNA polymerase sigma-70 factor, ECF subfamily [Actinacidiphila yanglinensis]|uniref:RNA polymerase sigma-70 factor, ECF subfamily n=1 Tax=Actinacidiphila yanglinensis TaxID=310779 RepID=A0A1H6A269_9ACTN|nr:RNA polymerase sigma factor SigJ [Actinacidiphila yanglinensis]SEG42304.1 RNA polymerase sigma-70 factor, ECF subfamily [Actinacidiphila yanglinensis]